MFETSIKHFSSEMVSFLTSI